MEIITTFVKNIFFLSSLVLFLFQTNVRTQNIGIKQYFNGHGGGSINTSIATAKPHSNTRGQGEIEAAEYAITTPTDRVNMAQKQRPFTEEPGETEAEEITTRSIWKSGGPTTLTGMWGPSMGLHFGALDLATIKPGTCKSYQDKSQGSKLILQHNGCEIVISQDEVIKQFGKPGEGSPTVHIRRYT